MLQSASGRIAWRFRKGRPLWDFWKDCYRRGSRLWRANRLKWGERIACTQGSPQITLNHGFSYLNFCGTRTRNSFCGPPDFTPRWKHPMEQRCLSFQIFLRSPKKKKVHLRQLERKWEKLGSKMFFFILQRWRSFSIKVNLKCYTLQKKREFFSDPIHPPTLSELQQDICCLIGEKML